MSLRMKRLVAASALLVVLVFLAEDIAARVWTTEPPCARAEAWTVTNKNALPTTLDGIAAFPVSYRKYIFSSLTPEQQSSLYREQFALMAQRTDWSTEQRVLLQDAWNMVSPQWYREERTYERSVRIREFELKIKAAFQEADRQLFFQLGPTKPRINWKSAGIVLSERVRGMFVAKASDSAFTPEGVCSCKYDWNCLDGQFCTDSLCTNAPCSVAGGETCTHHCDIPDPM